jgi:hypothetical protein
MEFCVSENYSRFAEPEVWCERPGVNPVRPYSHCVCRFEPVDLSFGVSRTVSRWVPGNRVPQVVRQRDGITQTKPQRGHH